MNRTIPLVLAAAALAATGCLNAEVTASSLCASQPGEQLPAAQPGAGSIDIALNLDLGSFGSNLDKNSVSGTVLMQQFDLSTDAGVDLAGVTQVNITVTSSDAGIQLDCPYAPTPDAGPVTALSVPCSSPNLFDYAREGSLSLDIQLVGSNLPPFPWTATLGACLSVDVSADYTKL